jgi:hypothetical protein
MVFQGAERSKRKAAVARQSALREAGATGAV